MRYIASLFLLLLVACAVTEPGDVAYRTFHNDSGQSVTVPGVQVEPQRAVYAEVAKCAGLSGDPEKITWYRLDEAIVFDNGENWYGVYVSKASEIWYLDSLAMRHEILHDLEYRHYHRLDHPSPPFGVCAEP